MDEISDLVSRARAGDKAAFGALAQQHIGMLIRIAYPMTGDYETAQELAQEAILQAYLSLRQLRDDALFRSWLYGIGLNVCRGYVRAYKAAPLSIEDLIGGTYHHEAILFDPTPTPEEMAETRELHQRLLDAVNALTPADREAVLLFYYEGMSIREAAILLNTTPGALRVRLHKARHDLREQLLAREATAKSVMEVQTMLPVEVLEVMYMQHTVEEASSIPQPIILLLDEANERVLPIWVGPHEGQLIQMILNKTPLPRPMTWHFTNNLLNAVGAQVESVTVSKLVDEVYYAITKLRFGEVVHEVDARPSDSIGLALNAQVPIFVAEAVMSEAGIKMGEQFKAGLAERKRMSRLTLEEITQLFPPPPSAPDMKSPTAEELKASGKQAKEKMKDVIGV